MKDYQQLAKELDDKRWDHLKSVPAIDELLDLSGKSEEYAAMSEDELAEAICIRGAYLIQNGCLTEETFEKYADFFKRNELPTAINAYADFRVKMAEEHDRRVQRKFIGSALRLAREAKGLSIPDVESKTGVSKSEISRVEFGRANATIDTLLKLAQCYGKSIEIVG